MFCSALYNLCNFLQLCRIWGANVVTLKSSCYFNYDFLDIIYYTNLFTIIASSFLLPSSCQMTSY